MDFVFARPHGADHWAVGLRRCPRLRAGRKWSPWATAGWSTTCPTNNRVLSKSPGFEPRLSTIVSTNWFVIDVVSCVRHWFAGPEGLRDRLAAPQRAVS